MASTDGVIVTAGGTPNWETLTVRVDRLEACLRKLDKTTNRAWTILTSARTSIAMGLPDEAVSAQLAELANVLRPLGVLEDEG